MQYAIAASRPCPVTRTRAVIWKSIYFKWPLVDRQTSTARFYDFALLCLFLKNLTVVNGWWACTQFFAPPLDVFSDLVVLGAYFQVANEDDGLFACRLFASDESPELIIFIFIIPIPLRLFSSPASVGLRAGRMFFDCS